jgi:hypothetical protein
VTVLYDACLLIAADRNDREVWADHRARLELGIVPVTTAPVGSDDSCEGARSLRSHLKRCTKSESSLGARDPRTLSTRTWSSLHPGTVFDDHVR